MKISLLLIIPVLVALFAVLLPDVARGIAHKAHEALFGFMQRQGLVLMAFAETNDYITGRKPIPTPAGGEVLAVTFEIELGTADLQLNDIGQIGILPAGCVPVDVFVYHDDLDSSTAALVTQIGIWDGSGASLSTDAADGGAHWGVTTASTAALSERLTRNGIAMETVTASTADRKLGMKVTTAPTTAVAGTYGVTMLYRAKR